MSKRPEQIIKTLKKHKGVLEVDLLDNDFIEAIKKEDLSVESSFGMPIDNQALYNCFSKEFALCIYANYSFEHPVSSVMIMKDSNNHVVGHDVSESQMETYQNREGMFWLSDNFVLYPDVDMNSNIRLVMMPQEYHGFSNEDGVSEATVFYPMPSTDCLIRNKYGYPMDSQIATVIMGIDLR